MKARRARAAEAPAAAIDDGSPTADGDDVARGGHRRRRRTAVGASVEVLDAPGFLLWQAANRWQRRLREALRDTELTWVQLVLLEGVITLGRAGGPVTQARLATHARTDTMMTSQVVRELERRALLERAPHPTDRRARQLVATAHGRALALRARPIVERVDADFLVPLGDRSSKFVKRLRQLARDDEGDQADE